jgi:hypothetical protein
MMMMMGRFAIMVLLGACGRVGFDPSHTGGPGGDGGGGGDGTMTGDGSSGSSVAYVGLFTMQMQTAAPSPFTFNAAAAQAGDLIVMQISCNGSISPPSITAPGWTFTEVGARASSAVKRISTDAFAAIAPDTATATFSATLGNGCDLQILSEEFANVAAGSISAVDAIANAVGTCATTVTTARADDTIWLGCAGASAGSPTSGYTLINGFEEYRVTTDPAGTLESPSLSGGSTAMVTVMAIAPQ